MSKKKSTIRKIAIVASNFNKDITDGLLSGAVKILYANGFNEKKIKIVRCPGAFEIPFIAKKLAKSKKY